MLRRIKMIGNKDLPFYDINCVRCRCKIKWFLINNRDNIDRTTLMNHLTDINMKDNKIVLDRLAKL